MEVFWLKQTQDEAPPGDEWLSAGERLTLARLNVPKRRADWRLGRWTAKCAVAALRPEADLPDIEVRPRESGAPAAFIRGRPAGLAISLSHSRSRGFCVVAEAAVAIGCDVEWIEARSPEFIQDYFTTLEQEIIAARRPALRAELVNLLWSAKESALKALGMGLRLNPQSLTVLASGVGASPGEWLELQASAETGRVFRGWWRSADGFVWTVLGRPRPLSLTAISYQRVIYGALEEARR